MIQTVAQLAEIMRKELIQFDELYAAAYALRSQTVKLDHFTPEEFGIWWPFMDTELLLGMDRFRGLLGEKVIISPAEDSLGRMSNKSSQHYPAPLVKAADIMPENVSLVRAYRVARQAGFHGIGVYPDWGPHPGLHVDMRPDRTAADPALWSARTEYGPEKDAQGRPKKKQIYGAIGDVIEDWQHWGQ